MTQNCLEVLYYFRTTRILLYHVENKMPMTAQRDFQSTFTQYFHETENLSQNPWAFDQVNDKSQADTVQGAHAGAVHYT